MYESNRIYCVWFWTILCVNKKTAKCFAPFWMRLNPSVHREEEHSTFWWQIYIYCHSRQCNRFRAQMCPITISQLNCFEFATAPSSLAKDTMHVVRNITNSIWAPRTQFGETNFSWFTLHFFFARVHTNTSRTASARAPRPTLYTNSKQFTYK